jgi:hypothetical protein
MKPRIFVGGVLKIFLPTAVASTILFILILGTKQTGIQPRPPEARSESEILALSVALESYKAEYGDYPIATNASGRGSATNANVLYRALVISNSAYNPSGKVFFEPYKGISASTNFNSTANYFIDPFGQPYQYRYPGDPQKSGTNLFDLFSYGKSRKTADEPANWESWIRNW